MSFLHGLPTVVSLSGHSMHELSNNHSSEFRAQSDVIPMLETATQKTQLAPQIMDMMKMKEKTPEPQRPAINLNA